MSELAMTTREDRSEPSSSASASPYSMDVRPWFIGVAYSAIESGYLDVLDFIVQRKAIFSAGLPNEIGRAFEVFQRIRDEWAELEAEYGDGAMLNLDSPCVRPDLAEDAVFPENAESVANARKMRAAKDSDWIRLAYEISTYAPGVPLPHRNARIDALWTDPQSRTGWQLRSRVHRNNLRS